MANNKQWMFSDIGWCELHQYMDNPPTFSLEDRHYCGCPIGNIDVVKNLITVLQGIVDEIEKPQLAGTTSKDFYCAECFYPQKGIPCNPEDGAIMGHCPRCDRQQTFIHGSPSGTEASEVTFSRFSEMVRRDTTASDEEE